MADPFIGEIRVVGFNFPPKGWAYCDGQLLPISQNTSLFAILGTMYGGDGKSTFALPDLQDRAVVNAGQGPGLSPYSQGQMGGSETVTLLQSEMPVHTHAVQASPDPAEVQAPAPDRSLARSGPGFLYQSSPAGTVPMSPTAAAPAGGSLPHNNRSPYLTLNYVIALQGIFPPHP